MGLYHQIIASNSRELPYLAPDTLFRTLIVNQIDCDAAGDYNNRHTFDFFKN
jgi:hypothetical protein